MDNSAIQEMIDTLEAEVIDDAEELLVWLGTDGVEFLKELLALRSLLFDVAIMVLDGQTPDDPCYNEKLVLKLRDGLSDLLELRK